MTSENLKNANLIQKFNLEALEQNSQLEQKWKQCKEEYEQLWTCLNEFPKELSAPILTPLGSKVYVRAQLCNTNEVFIRYNDVFTKQTAYEAKAVCERHIKRCDGMIENLTKENKLLNDNFFARQEIINESDRLITAMVEPDNLDQMIDIIEPLDPEEFSAWRETHRQKVKEYKQQLLEEKNNEQKIKVNQCEKMLNAVEKADCNVFDAMLIQLDHGRESYLPISDSDDSSSRESCDDEDDEEDDSIDDDVDEDDDEDDDDSKLEIVFTNDVPETTRNFSKKIKKKVSFNNDVQIKEFEPRPEEHFIRRREETIKETEKPEILVTEIDDIVERVYDTYLENETDDEEENARPISRFKANRNKRSNIK